MKLEHVLLIIFVALLAIGAAKAGPIMNCTTPGDVWNTTTSNLDITYFGGYTFLEYPPKTFFDITDYGRFKSLLGANDKQTLNIKIRNDEAFTIGVATIYKAAEHNLTNWIWQQSAQQKNVSQLGVNLAPNANPALRDFVDYVIDFDTPYSGEFDQNITVEFEAVTGPCSGQHLNVTYNIRGTAFPFTFVSGIPPGWSAEWPDGTDAETNDSMQDTNVTLFDSNYVATVFADVTPDTTSVQALDFSTMVAETDPETGRVYVDFDWATYAPEVNTSGGDNHYILLRKVNQYRPFVCDSATIDSLDDVYVGCDGFDATPSWINLYYLGAKPPVVSPTYRYFGFATTHSGAGQNGNSNLTMFDSAEDSFYYRTTTNPEFYVYYYNASNASDPIHTMGSTTDGCFIEFDDAWGTHYLMDWNGSHYNYTKTGGFSGSQGLRYWNVTCNDTNGAFTAIIDVQDDILESTTTNLTIWDNSSGTAEPNAPITFYAQYWRIGPATPFTPSQDAAECKINIEGTNYSMAWNVTNSRWNYTYSGYSSEGTKTWKVWCTMNDTSYINLTTFATMDITAGGAAVPEFSDLGWILACVLGAGGFILTRRKKSF